MIIFLKDFGTSSNRTYPSSCCTTDLERRPLASPVSSIYPRIDEISSNSLSIQAKLNFSEHVDVEYNIPPAAKAIEAKAANICRVYQQVRTKL